MKKVVLYAMVAVVLISGIIVYANKGAGKDDSQTASVTNIISVAVQNAKTADKETGMTYKAELEPCEEGIVSSKAAGKVMKILFENGDVVSPGDTLVILDAQELNNQLKAAENQLKAAENQLVTAKITMRKIEENQTNAKRDYDRTKSLFDQSAVSQAEMEYAETALKMAQTDMDTAKANLDTLNINIEASKININSLKDALGNTVIKAPIKGVMDEKSVSLGQFVSPGIPLAKVKDLSEVYAVIKVEQQNINKIKVGQKALVSLEDGTGVSAEGTITNIDASADAASRLFKCRIKVDNKDQKFHPGVFARAEIENDQKIQVVTVPISALAGNEGSYYLFVNDNGIARKRAVTIGGIVKDNAEILSGVQANESVICSNINMLQDGDKITVVKE